MLIVHNFKPAAPVGQNYAEWSYFDGFHFAHIAAWQEANRLKRLRNDARKLLERRKCSR